jgi:hypothetical protein
VTNPVLFNPYTGARRSPREIKSDPEAKFLIAPVEKVGAATKTRHFEVNGEKHHFNFPISLWSAIDKVAMKADMSWSEWIHSVITEGPERRRGKSSLIRQALAETLAEDGFRVPMETRHVAALRDNWKGGESVEVLIRRVEAFHGIGHPHRVSVLAGAAA